MANIAEKKDAKPLDLGRIPSEIAPSFTFRALFIGTFAVLVSFFALFVHAEFLPALILLPLAGCIVWCYFGSWYSLRPKELYIHFGPFRRSIPYAEIRRISVPFTYRNSTLMGLSHDCIELKMRSGLMRTVCISPIKQYRVFDLISERCPDLEEN